MQVKGLGDMSMWVWVNFLYTHKDRVEKEREAVSFLFSIVAFLFALNVFRFIPV